MSISNFPQRKPILTSRLVLALSLGLAISSPAPAQSSAATGMNMTKMTEQCVAMKHQKQKIADDMKAQNAQLTGELNRMNRAPADQKMGVMANILTQIVEQRIAMDTRKVDLDEEMMKHMMQHMQMSKETMAQSMAQCPMMSGMKGMNDKPADAHKH